MIKTDELPIIKIDNINLEEEQKNMNENSSKDNKDSTFPIKILKRIKTKKFDFLSIDPDYFEKEMCISCRKGSILGEILYENANNYFSEFLDIETLFLNYQEVDMLKKIFFDYDQRRLFEFLSRFSNLPNIFSLTDRKTNVDLFDDNGSEIFRIFERLIERANENDLKLIKLSNIFFKN